MKKLVLILFVLSMAFALVSCMPEASNEITTPPDDKNDESSNIDDMIDEEPVNPLVGFWIGRNEYIRFREDGTFQFIKIYFGGSTDTYEGTWSMTEDGKLTAMYVRKGGTLYIDTYVAHDSILRWRNENEFDYPNPYGGTYYFTRAE